MFQLELIKTIADKAMEIHRKNKKIIPLAIHEAVNEIPNLIEDRRLELKKEVQKELTRRSQAAKAAKKNRMGNKWHGGPMSSIRRVQKKLK